MKMCRFSGGGGGGGVVVFIAGLLGSGCNKPTAPPMPPPPPVSVARPIDREVQEWDEYPGRLESAHLQEVRAQISGYLQEVKFKEGAIVNKGDVLFVIDPRPFEAEVA